MELSSTAALDRSGGYCGTKLVARIHKAGEPDAVCARCDDPVHPQSLAYKCEACGRVYHVPCCRGFAYCPGDSLGAASSEPDAERAVLAKPPHIPSRAPGRLAVPIVVLTVALVSYLTYRQQNRGPQAAATPAVAAQPAASHTPVQPIGPLPAPPTAVSEAAGPGGSLPSQRAAAAAVQSPVPAIPPGYTLVLDDRDPSSLELTPPNSWEPSVNAGEAFRGHAYVAYGGTEEKRATFRGDIPRAGVYQVAVHSVVSSREFRSDRVQVQIHTSQGPATATLNQVGTGEPTEFISLGEYPFPAGTVPILTLTTAGVPPNGRVAVCADAVRLTFVR